MSNEAAERLLLRATYLHDEGESPDSDDLRRIRDWMKEALATERKATVDRIRAAVHADTPKVPDIGTSIAAWLDAILDAEAARGA